MAKVKYFFLELQKVYRSMLYFCKQVSQNTRKQSDSTTMRLLQYVILTTCIFVTASTSINRINYGISFQQLRASKIAMSEYVYDYIITLPYNTIEHRNKIIPTCNSNSRIKTQAGPTHKLLPPNETPRTVDCSQALDSLIHTLHDTNRDIHKEVDDLITRILDELPEEVML